MDLKSLTSPATRVRFPILFAFLGCSLLDGCCDVWQIDCQIGGCEFSFLISELKRRLLNPLATEHKLTDYAAPDVSQRLK